MNRRILIDLLLIIVVYAVYWGCVYAATTFNLPLNLNVSPPVGMEDAEFLSQFNSWALTVMGISGFAVIAWYVLGAWGPKAHTTSHGVWLLIWFLGLVVTLLGGFLAIYFGPQPSENGYALVIFYLFGGAFFYYLATVLFSPANVKFSVPLSRYLRRW